MQNKNILNRLLAIASLALLISLNLSFTIMTAHAQEDAPPSIDAPDFGDDAGEDDPPGLEGPSAEEPPPSLEGPDDPEEPDTPAPNPTPLPPAPNPQPNPAPNPLPKTGPELAFLLVPSLALGSGYYYAKKRKNRKNR